MKLFFVRWFENQQAQDIQQAEELQQTQGFLVCPSFEDEPWKSRAERLRPKSLDTYLAPIDLDAPLPPPLPSSSRYTKLLLRFLDAVPKECWIDEENEED